MRSVSVPGEGLQNVHRLLALLVLFSHKSPLSTFLSYLTLMQLFTYIFIGCFFVSSTWILELFNVQKCTHKVNNIPNMGECLWFFTWWRNKHTLSYHGSVFGCWHFQSPSGKSNRKELDFSPFVTCWRNCPPRRTVKRPVLQRPNLPSPGRQHVDQETLPDRISRWDSVLAFELKRQRCCKFF